MTSGEYISYFGIGVYLTAVLGVVIFTVWEFVQLARRRGGNKSARTMSQWIEHRAKDSNFWKEFALWFPHMLGGFALFLVAVSVWLVFHWQV